MPAFIRLLCDRVALLFALWIPYIAAGFVFSALFVWLSSHVNPDPWVLPAMQFATALWTIVKLVLLVLLIIAYWRALFLGEEPRLKGLRVIPKVFLAVFWRVLLIATIATFFAQATYYLSFRMIQQTLQNVLSGSQYLIYYSGVSFVIYSVGTYLLSRVCLGIVSISIGRSTLSVLASWEGTRSFRRDIVILSIQLGAVVSLLYAGNATFQTSLAQLAHGHMPVFAINMASSVSSVLASLVVIWFLASAMAIAYSRSVEIPTKTIENVDAVKR
ncbi:hypothetical protein GCM10016455_12780 [Aliiroseovarius zhejiangensis]|uniref:Uncharacterized protein n=1 Tax=Aliiroseovarius zhejiangensis TaxID=1632025 RepID=A0ABQ3ITC9_9RHOB|nr:hypothetical protein [Aliiroseovarius zhejiangensis]GHE93990.1 hypothetical protein GCM10016455_12780 [Aliiroseovarius zhejiangensis]